MVEIQKQILHSRKCEVCEEIFKPKSGRHIYCSPKCKGRVQYISGYGSVENQNRRISYNWRRYLQRLLYHENRRHLTIDILLDLIKKQNYKCALTGHELTCVLNKGIFCFTNASLDRIYPGGPYSLENIRLVCRIANIMKWNMEDAELRRWCERILKYEEGT